jgi:hypothetical protein
MTDTAVLIPVLPSTSPPSTPSTLARTLLRPGADPDIRDHRFDSTPLGWARHFGQQALIDLLEPLTAPDPEGDPATAPHLPEGGDG